MKILKTFFYFQQGYIDFYLFYWNNLSQLLKVLSQNDFNHNLHRKCALAIAIDSLFYSVIHVFPWSGIVNENFELNDTFRVPSLKEGRMVRLISQLSTKEEEMFRNMVRRVNTLVKVCDNCQHIMQQRE